MINETAQPENNAPTQQVAPNNELLCVVSPHVKGFWQADIFVEGWQEGAAPDWFCTGKIGGTKEEIIVEAKQHYPAAKVTDGITGICIDCGEEQFNLESECGDCGGIVGDA